MARKRISREKIIGAFLSSSFDKGAGATSLQDIADLLQIKKASLYNHFSSRDEMYCATLEYCRGYLAAVNFLPEELRSRARLEKETPVSAFQKIVSRCLKLYEAEPLFQIYVFIHSEQYFNREAAEAADAERGRAEKSAEKILRYFSAAGKTARLSPPETRAAACRFASFLFHQTDVYIMHKKEIVRRNPESGAGSLFALPTDDAALAAILRLSDGFVRAECGSF